MGMTKRPPHREIFAPVVVDRAKRVALRPGQLYRRSVVNIQKIQNGDSEFFVNSRRRMRQARFKC